MICYTNMNGKIFSTLESILNENIHLKEDFSVLVNFVLKPLNGKYLKIETERKCENSKEYRALEYTLFPVCIVLFRPVFQKLSEKVHLFHKTEV